MKFFTIIQIFATVLFILGYCPQVLELLKKKRTDGISLRSWLIWTSGWLLTEVYVIGILSVTGRGWALIGTTTANLMFCTFTTCLVIYYRKLNKRPLFLKYLWKRDYMEPLKEQA